MIQCFGIVYIFPNINWELLNRFSGYKKSTKLILESKASNEEFKKPLYELLFLTLLNLHLIYLLDLKRNK